MTVLLTVRGTLAPKTLDAARVLHNETAGSQPGVAAARALGDLSHNVYVAGKGPRSTAREGELLFLDRWADPSGIAQFFANPRVQEGAGALFGKRDAAVWTPAAASFSFTLPVPKARRERISCRPACADRGCEVRCSGVRKTGRTIATDSAPARHHLARAVYQGRAAWRAARATRHGRLARCRWHGRALRRP